MKSGNRYILYIFLILLIGIGITLFLIRNQAADFLNESTGVSTLVVPTKVASSSKDSLDTAMFTNTKFLSLKNNVNKFDFNSICKTPVGQIETVSTSSDGEVVTTKQTLSCVQGNSVPFPLPVKTK